MVAQAGRLNKGVQSMAPTLWPYQLLGLAFEWVVLQLVVMGAPAEGWDVGNQILLKSSCVQYILLLFMMVAFNSVQWFAWAQEG